jgi:hypothetical protein
VIARDDGTNVQRICGVCDGRMGVYEQKNLAGMPFVQRYRCGGCGTKWDLLTPLGGFALGGLGVSLPAIVALLPERKFQSSSDRLWILVFLVAQLAVIVGLIVRSRRNAARHPLVR